MNPFPKFDIKVDLRRALAGGILAAIITAGGAWILGHLSQGEAQALMDGMATKAHSLQPQKEPPELSRGGFPSLHSHNESNIF